MKSAKKQHKHVIRAYSLAKGRLAKHLGALKRVSVRIGKGKIRRGKDIIKRSQIRLKAAKARIKNVQKGVKHAKSVAKLAIKKAKKKVSKKKGKLSDEQRLKAIMKEQERYITDAELRAKSASSLGREEIKDAQRS